MRSTCRWIVAFALLHLGAVEAQIYTCTAKDGTRIFSDEKCGPDAKLVPNISSTKRSSTNSAPRPKVEPKSATELDELLKQCNDGEMTACNTWTKAGGPNSLREKEGKAEKACEAGSLADCEYRYCGSGASEECRTRIVQTAKMSGDNWYLRDTGQAQSDGSTRYNVRCMPAGARIMRDVVVSCAAKAGPARCVGPDPQQSFPRLDAAAAKSCEVPR